MNIKLLGALLLLFLFLVVILFSRRQIGDYSDPRGPYFEGYYGGEQAQSDGSLRVVTWNLHHAEFVEQVIDALDNVEELRNADVLLLQEVDLAGVESIAHRLGYNYVFYPAVLSRRSRVEFGNAVLSLWPLTDPEKIVLPNAIPGWLESRNAARATISMGSREILVYSVHLDTTWIIPTWVQSHEQFLVEEIERGNKFIILGGDFNSWTSGSIKLLENGLGKAGLVRISKGTGYTFEFSDLKLTLDHIFSGEVVDFEAGVYRQTNASDHYPIWADMEITGND